MFLEEHISVSEKSIFQSPKGVLAPDAVISRAGQKLDEEMTICMPQPLGLFPVLIRTRD